MAPAIAAARSGTGIGGQTLADTNEAGGATRTEDAACAGAHNRDNVIGMGRIPQEWDNFAMRFCVHACGRIPTSCKQAGTHAFLQRNLLGTTWRMYTLAGGKGAVLTGSI